MQSTLGTLSPTSSTWPSRTCTRGEGLPQTAKRWGRAFFTTVQQRTIAAQEMRATGGRCCAVLRSTQRQGECGSSPQFPAAEVAENQILSDRRAQLSRCSGCWSNSPTPPTSHRMTSSQPLHLQHLSPVHHPRPPASSRISLILRHTPSSEPLQLLTTEAWPRCSAFRLSPPLRPSFLLPIRLARV